MRSRVVYALYPYGETRWSSGMMATDRRFTGQREETGLGLYDYVARRYDPYISRWIQPDTIIPDPGNPQSLNRYTYVYNNPLNSTDPTGHCVDDDVVCQGLANALYQLYGWRTHGQWSLAEMYELARGATILSAFYAANGGGDAAARLRATTGVVHFHAPSDANWVTNLLDRNNVQGRHVYFVAGFNEATVIHENGTHRRQPVESR